jgi:dihydrolipoamide dehydrogenase
MKYDVIIIGSGPAGYVAAIRAGQVGLKTAIIEKGDIGGMCLNWGCMPSKSMIESAKLYKRINEDAAKFGIDGIDKKEVSFNFNKAIKRSSGIVKRLSKGVEFLLTKNGVDIIKGEAEITSENTVSADNRSFEADHILIATGSKSPEIESKHEGLVVNTKELFTEREVPENIVIVGNDSVSVELTQLFNMIGKNVTLAVPGDRLMPLADVFLSNHLLGIFKKEKIKVIMNADLENTDTYKDGNITIADETIACDMIINAKTRFAVLPKFKIDLETENGYLKTDKDCKTKFSNIYGVGDVNGKSRFAHIGSAQGLFVINSIKGVKAELDMKKYPLNMYSVPEMAQIGLTEKDIQEEGIEYKESIFPLSANGKAMTEGANDGLVRILSEKKYGEVLGVQIIAPNATDMIAEAAAFMQVESTIYDVAQTVHAHPTISEVFMEAAFEGIDGAIHK